MSAASKAPRYFFSDQPERRLLRALRPRGAEVSTRIFFCRALQARCSTIQGRVVSDSKAAASRGEWHGH